MKTTSLFPLFLLTAAILVLPNCLYVIREIDKAVLLTFGEVTNSDIAPGLHFKLPGVHTLRRFDGRIQTLDIDTESYLTAEKNYLEVDSFAKWRVANTARFYTATGGDESRIDSLLQQRINTALRNQFGVRTVHEVVAGERDLLMTTITQNLNRTSLEELGIEVVDVRVKRIDLPDNVSDSVFLRMNTERQEEAQQLRSTGLEIAEGIRADADRQQTIIEAEAYRDAERLRGEGDAEAAAIYAQAFSKDPEFYNFTRSLNAYRESLGNKDDLLLLSPDSDFFKYLKNGSAKP
ncbi:MAG: protease modulator HflC [Pseudomonadales bacterium]|jgi:membrane protease subunit HflC|nr:protease modulator HflC [Pseudomonadales bacterium]